MSNRYVHVCVDKVQDPRACSGGYFPHSGVKGNVAVLRDKFRKSKVELNCTVLSYIFSSISKFNPYTTATFPLNCTAHLWILSSL